MAAMTKARKKLERRQPVKPAKRASHQKRLTTLDKIEAEVAKDFEKKRKSHKRAPGEMEAHNGLKRKRSTDGGRHNRKKRPVPRPKGKTAKEVAAMDADDESFKFPQGRPRKVAKATDSTEHLSWKEAAARDKQDRTNKRRAKRRKREAVEAAVLEENSDIKVSPQEQRRMKITPVDEAIAVGAINLDDWDEEEIAKGYRKNRAGHFGPAPKFIAREVQQEAFRRIVQHGDKILQDVYLTAMSGLANLATNAQSEKVQLDAIKEIQDRLVGKVPDHLRLAAESPFQDMLADSLVPVTDLPALSAPIGDDGVARMLPLVDDEGPVEAPTDAPASEATAEVVDVAPGPSPTSEKPAIKKIPAKRRRKKKVTP